MMVVAQALEAQRVAFEEYKSRARTRQEGHATALQQAHAREAALEATVKRARDVLATAERTTERVRSELASEEEAHALALCEVGDYGAHFSRRVYRRHRAWESCFGAWQSHLAAEQRGILKGKRSPPWVLKLDRGRLIYTLLAACGTASKRQLVCAPTEVKFLDEAGIDEGGLSREMWSLFRSELFSYEVGGTRLFEPLSGANSAFVPTEGCTSAEQLQSYRMLGRLMAKAVVEQEHLPPQPGLECLHGEMCSACRLSIIRRP